VLLGFDIEGEFFSSGLDLCCVIWLAMMLPRELTGK
jgi:hypothetical protein